MKKIIFLSSMLALLLLVENSFAGWKETEISRFVPLPPKIEIIRPPSDLPKEVDAFSGRWEGIWYEGIREGVRSILIVEKINSTEAQGIYGWEKYGNFKADYIRWKSKILCSTGRCWCAKRYTHSFQSTFYKHDYGNCL